MEEVKQLLTIEIDQAKVKQAIDAAAKARAELVSLKEANKKLSKSEEDNSVAITKNSVKMKQLSATIRENEKVVVANSQAQDTSRGTIDRLRKQLVVVSHQWAAVTEAEGENSEESERLAKKKKQLTDLLKAEEKATGDTRRNVGNYTEGVIDAIDSTNLFGTSLKGTVSGLKAATAASLKFLATPLGAVIGAVALAISGVVAAFKTLRGSLERTERGQAALSKVFSVFRGITNGVMKVVEPLALLLADGLAVGFELVTKAVMSASKAIANALDFLGLDDWADGLRKVNNEIEKTQKATIELASAERELNQIRREQEKLQLASQKRAEELRQIRDDEQRSIEDRIKANEQLGVVLEEQQQRELELAQRALEIAQLRADAEGESTENLDAIAEAETKILEIQERITGQRSEQLVNINSLLKEQRDLELESNELAVEALAERLGVETDLIKQFHEKVSEIRDEDIVKIKEQYAQGLIDKAEYEEGLLQIEKDSLSVQKLQAELAKEDALNDLEITEAERIKIIAEAEAQILAIREKSAELAIAANSKANDAQAKDDREVAKVKKTTGADVLDFAKKNAKEGTVIAKATGVADATVSTYKAANLALASAPPPLNFIQAAIVTGAGLANVAKIAGSKVVGFATGGYTGGGYGQPDSSGYKPAGIVHEGEYVVTKSMVESPKFSPMINYLEQNRLKGYADGGLVGRSASFEGSQSGQLAMLQNSINRLSNKQSVVRVTDINRVNEQVQTVRVSGSLT